MTFEEYIVNPMGKNNAILSAAVRETQRNIYSTKFDNILLRENGKIDYFLYKGKDETYYAHIKIPSEVVKNFYYDVVIKFIGSTKTGANLSNLDKYQVQFFSNDPAFVYTYTYVFKNKGLFIKELSTKMSSKALRLAPKEKNPGQMVGYVKSLYFAYLFMKQRGLFNKLKYQEAQPAKIQYMLNHIEAADKKIQDRQDEGAKVSKRKDIKVDKETYGKLKRSGVSSDNLSNLKVTTTKKVGVVKNRAINNVKKSNKTKRF